MCATKPDRIEFHQHHVADYFFRKVGVLAHQVSNVVKNRNIREQGAKLEQHPHSPAHRIELGMAHIGHRLSIDQQSAAGGLQLTADQTQQGGFTTPGVTHNGNKLPTRNIHGDSLENRPVVVSKVNVGNLDQAIGGHNSIREKNRARLYANEPLQKRQ